jgi:hypothetical protein
MGITRERVRQIAKGEGIVADRSRRSLPRERPDEQRVRGSDSIEEGASQLIREYHNSVAGLPFRRMPTLKDMFGKDKQPVRGTRTSAAIRVLLNLGNACTDPIMRLWFWDLAGIPASDAIRVSFWARANGELPNQKGEADRRIEKDFSVEEQWRALLGGGMDA